MSFSELFFVIVPDLQKTWKYNKQIPMTPWLYVEN